MLPFLKHITKIPNFSPQFEIPVLEFNSCIISSINTHHTPVYPKLKKNILIDQSFRISSFIIIILQFFLMTFLEFQASLKQEYPPKSLSPLLKALWLEAKGNWVHAHKIADDVGGSLGNWVHAYLHRKEGDLWNAGYWYSRAGKQKPTISLDEEWKIIVLALLGS